jgi:UDP-galactopyranose mutase
MRTDWLIVGAGFAGCTLAQLIADRLGQKVLLVERRDHIGGNAYDYYDEHGLLVHEYGPHIFHTNSKRVWDHLSRFTDWRPYEHRVLAVIDGKKVPLPFNLNSLYALFPPRYASKLEDLLLKHYPFGAKIPILKLKASASGDLRFLAEYVYDKVFYGYTLKQWELKPEELDPSVTARVPFSVSRDDRYFQDTYQAMPRLGYTQMFRQMLKHPNIRVLLNADYKDVTDEVRFGRMIYTGAIDAFFDYAHGPLPYRSLRWERLTVDQEYHQEAGTVNYPNEHDYTRITEQKYLTGQRLPKSTLMIEYPQRYVPDRNEPFYPVPTQDSRKTYDLYLQEARELDGKVVFVGRLADYKYYNMDQVVARALSVFEKEVAS